MKRKNRLSSSSAEILPIAFLGEEKQKNMLPFTKKREDILINS